VTIVRACRAGLWATAFLSVACGRSNVTGPSAIPTQVTSSSRVLPPGPRLAHTRFLAFGDSITSGTTSPAVTNALTAGPPVSYPYKLRALLSAYYSEQTIIVDNGGKTGEAAEDAVFRLRDVMRDSSPQVIILLHGVNDVSVQGIRAVPKTLASMNSMVNDAKSEGVIVVLCTLLPQRPGALRAGDPAAIAAYNEGLRDLARSKSLLLIDFAADFGGVTLIGVDGLHPTEAGYDRMADMVFATVKKEFERPPTLH
jgi:lysophospholipase L1-like esterase